MAGRRVIECNDKVPGIRVTPIPNGTCTCGGEVKGIRGTPIPNGTRTREFSFPPMVEGDSDSSSLATRIGDMAIDVSDGAPPFPTSARGIDPGRGHKQRSPAIV